MLTTPTHVCCEQLRECGAERAVVVHTCMFERGVVCCGEPVILVGSSILGIRAVIMWLGKNQLASQSVSQPVSPLVSQSDVPYCDGTAILSFAFVDVLGARALRQHGRGDASFIHL